MLCRVLHVNRSTYYNFINKKHSKREIENQHLRKLLLEIYMKAKKRIGTRAFKIILLRDYGVNISEGRILRLLKSMTLPKMSTIKPRFKSRKRLCFLLKTCLNSNLIVIFLIKFGRLISLIFLWKQMSCLPLRYS